MDHSKFKESPAYPRPSLTMRLRLIHELYGHAKGICVDRTVLQQNKKEERNIYFIYLSTLSNCIHTIVSTTRVKHESVRDA